MAAEDGEGPDFDTEEEYDEDAATEVEFLLAVVCSDLEAEDMDPVAIERAAAHYRGTEPYRRWCTGEERLPYDIGAEIEESLRRILSADGPN